MSSMVNQFETLLDAITNLIGRGYNTSFKVAHKVLEVIDGPDIQPEDVSITEYHRFEGESNPDDMSVIYAIETSGGLKGVLIDAYGAYSDESVTEFLKKVKFKEKEVGI